MTTGNAGGFAQRKGTVNGQVVDELMTTGAGVAGRADLGLVGGWDGDGRPAAALPVAVARSGGTALETVWQLGRCWTDDGGRPGRRERTPCMLGEWARRA
jgi:hypothetical protein